MPLQYRGRASDSAVTLVAKSAADAAAQADVVSANWLATQIGSAQATLVSATPSPNYVDTLNAGLAQKTYVDAQDQLYLPVGALGQPSSATVTGVAGLDSGGNLVNTQIPAGLRTNRIATAVTGTATITSPQTVLASQTSSSNVNVRGVKLGTATVLDPGYPWLPLVFAQVAGNSAAVGSPASRQVGNGSYGLLAVCPPAGVSDQLYGLGTATASVATDVYSVLPFATLNQNPAIISPGQNVELDLWGSCWPGGVSYTFFPPTSYFVLVLPAL